MVEHFAEARLSSSRRWVQCEGLQLEASPFFQYAERKGPGGEKTPTLITFYREKQITPQGLLGATEVEAGRHSPML